MWSDGQAANGHGEPVLLFQPVGGGGSRQNNINKSRHKSNSSTSHHLGGLPCYHERDKLLSSIIEENSGSTNPRCKICNKHMYLLIQLHAPLDELDRTLYVFGCNTLACHSQGDTDNEGLGDDVERSNSFHPCKTRGSVCCLRSQQCWAALPDQPKSRDSEKPKNLLGNDWGVDDGNDGWGVDDDDGWGGGNNTANGGNVSIDDLETMLNNCEMKSAVKKSPPPSSAVPVPRHSSQTATSDEKKNCIEPSFEHHDLESLYEPMVDKTGGNDDDDDDDEDGVEYGNVDASKVDEMLSRYLDMEDDEEILLALKGGKKINSGGNFGGSGGERYERLPPGERALLAFSTRLKRSPGQVARYAYGGVPLWSMPLPRPKSNVSKTKQKSIQLYSPLPVVPNCACGAERVFEFQILPSVLHVLDVDSHATGGRNEKSNDLLDLISAGGMNWGVIAIYSCPESCDDSREEFVIVQEAVSDVPIRKHEEIDDASDNDMEGNTEDMT